MSIVLDGIAYGLQLSLLAVGMTLIYGLGGVLNLAHGQLAVVTAVVGSLLLSGGLAVPAALASAVAAAGAIAWLLDASVMRPVYRLTGQRRVLLSLMVSLGIALLIDGLAIALQPFAVLSLSVPGPAVDVLGVPMRRGSLLASGVAIAALVALLAWLRMTAFGRAVRAMLQDERGAQLCGVRPPLVRTVVFVLSGLAAGLFAVSQALLSSVGTAAGLDFTILALIVAVVGGLGRVGGTLIAGLALGLVHALASFHIGSVGALVILLVAVMAVVLLRPAGVLRAAA